MALTNPNYNKDLIIKTLANEYNVPYDRIHSIIFGQKVNGNIGANLKAS